MKKILSILASGFCLLSSGFAATTNTIHMQTLLLTNATGGDEVLIYSGGATKRQPFSNLVSSVSSLSKPNSFNLRKVVNLATALRGTNVITVAKFSDSVGSPNTGGKINGFITNMVQVYGMSGAKSVNYPWLYAPAASWTSIPKNANWWTAHYKLSAGTNINFIAATANGPSNFTDRVWCDSVRADFLYQPGAGDFTLRIATNNSGTYIDKTNINCNSTLSGGSVTIPLTLGYYTMQIVCNASTNTIITAGMWNQNQLNVTTLANDEGSIALNDWTAIPTNITWPIWTAWRPTVTLFEMKDTADIFRTNIPIVENMWTNCTPSNDVIYIETTPLLSGDDTFTIPQNAVMWSNAVVYGRALWDGYSVFPSYTNATLAGYTDTGDGTHFNAAGGMLLGGMLWADIKPTLGSIAALNGTTNSGTSSSSYTFPGMTTNLYNSGNFTNVGTAFTGANGVVLGSTANNQGSIWAGVHHTGDGGAFPPNSTNWVIGSDWSSSSNYQTTTIKGQLGINVVAGNYVNNRPYWFFWPSGGASFMDMHNNGDRLNDPGAENLRVAGSIMAGGAKVATNGEPTEIFVGPGAFGYAKNSATVSSNIFATATDGIYLDVLKYDASTAMTNGFAFRTPEKWDKGTIRVKLDWKPENAIATASNTVWKVAIGVLTNGATGGSVLGSWVSITNACPSTTNIVVSTPASNPITVGGFATNGALALVAITRATGGYDTVSNNTMLVMATMQFGTQTNQHPYWVSGQ